jgi:ribosome-associated heat shock protein Hsp15
MVENVRIDKWMWAVRLFKTRSQATEACKKGRVLIDGESVKPSRMVKIDEIIIVKKQPVIYTYRVIGLLEQRQGAKIAAEYYENLTSEKELMKLDVKKYFPYEQREKGAGRPTKKERRTIEEFKNK